MMPRARMKPYARLLSTSAMSSSDAVRYSSGFAVGAEGARARYRTGSLGARAGDGLTCLPHGRTLGPGAAGKRRMSRSGAARRGDHTAGAAGQAAYLTAGRGGRWRQTLAAAFAMPHLAIPAPAARTGRISFAIGLAASDVPCCPGSAAARIRAKRPLAEQGQVV